MFLQQVTNAQRTMTRVSFLLYVLTTVATAAIPTHIPQELHIKTDACSYWEREGLWLAANGSRVASFKTSCYGFDYNDVLIFTRENEKDSLWIYADEAFFQIYTQIELRNGREGPLLGLIEERFWKSKLSITSLYYELFARKDDEDSKWADVRFTRFFSKEFTVTAKGNDTILASSKLSYSKQLEADYFCDDAVWKLHFAASTTQQQRAVIAAMLTTKSLHDENRNEDGDLTMGACTITFIGLAFVLPGIFFVCIIILCVILCCRERK